MSIDPDKEEEYRWNTSKASFLREAATVQTLYFICQDGGHTNQDPVVGEADRNRETLANRT
jgi:hypothetical protein